MSSTGASPKPSSDQYALTSMESNIPSPPNSAALGLIVSLFLASHWLRFFVRFTCPDPMSCAIGHGLRRLPRQVLIVENWQI
ncbi:hypothetical protein ACRALDRAFT_211731 [Sodiomyces alcalophilus JCM 7366]|uniref:uncharacterized protein n=1 Tax=Sodiomyces alcalophilus JCM 7366 TaxID=591952 RepID=UPI0039B5CEEE